MPEEYITDIYSLVVIFHNHPMDIQQYNDFYKVVQQILKYLRESFTIFSRQRVFFDTWVRLWAYI